MKKAKYEFNWREFTEDDLKKANERSGDPENDVYGFALLNVGACRYIIDVHYENYGRDQQGFDLEVYDSDSRGYHYRWLGSIKTICSAKNYKYFCHRAEDAVIDLIRNQEVA